MRKKYVIKKKDNLKECISNNNKNYLKFEKHRYERESSFDCNFNSCNISVSNKNFKYNKIQKENENNKNQRNGNFSFLNVSSKKKSDTDLNSILTTFKNHFSSSRSCNKEKKNNSYLSIGSIDKLSILNNNPKKNNKNNIIINSNSTNNLIIGNYNNINHKLVINNKFGAVKNIIIKNKIYSFKNQSYDNKKKYTINSENSN